MDAEECGRVSVHDSLLDVAWFYLHVRVRRETERFVWKFSDSCH